MFDNYYDNLPRTIERREDIEKLRELLTTIENLREEIEEVLNK